MSDARCPEQQLETPPDQRCLSFRRPEIMSKILDYEIDLDRHRSDQQRQSADSKCELSHDAAGWSPIFIIAQPRWETPRSGRIGLRHVIQAESRGAELIHVPKMRSMILHSGGPSGSAGFILLLLGGAQALVQRISDRKRLQFSSLVPAISC